MKKLFNVKTGQFLELGGGQIYESWYDGKDHILIMLEFDKAKSLDINFEDADEDPKNPTYLLYCLKYKQNLSHSLNAMWNGIYNGCVYGDGEYVVVDFTYFKLDDNIRYFYNGDVINVYFGEQTDNEKINKLLIKCIRGLNEGENVSKDSRSHEEVSI